MQKRVHIIICITDLLCCTPETNTTLKSTILQYIKKKKLNITDFANFYFFINKIYFSGLFFNREKPPKLPLSP